MSVTWRATRELLREPFATDVNDLLEADPGDWFVTCGWRSSEEQAKLHALYLAGGPKATAPGNSAHESGLAVDVTLVDDADHGHDDWDYTDAAWQRMIAAVKAHPRLHSLVDIGDGDHIESVRWKEIRDSGIGG